MNTPGTALVGYAILRANYNAQAPNYLDNFVPFVLSAIAHSNSQSVERNAVSELIREMFGLSIPTLVLPRLLRRTNKQGLTAPVGNSAIRLTARAISELPDLNAEVTQYRSRQTELVTQLAAFIESHFPEHLELTTRDLSAHLAEFFDKNAVPLLGASLTSSQPVRAESTGLDYVVSVFVDNLYKTDQVRFGYVVEAAKGAMLASVLELDMSNMSDSLAQLIFVLDSPVVMDLLGYHGPVPETAMKHVLALATKQGATLAMFRHSLSELDGILEAIESSLRRGSLSRSTSTGYLHFTDIGAEPADIAELRGRLEKEVTELGISVIDLPGGYYEYGLDENKLENIIQRRVHYLQDAARVNDVHSISAIHRLREGNQSSTIERCKAVFISSNSNLVRGAREFNHGPAFPLAVTAEAIASILWLRSSALADEVPREIVLASAYAGMQPSPILWKKYVDEIEKLEQAGSVSQDGAMILRATSIGRDAFMYETLGDEEAVSNDLPFSVLERVQNSIAEPLQREVVSLESQLTNAEVQARQTLVEKTREVSARQAAEAEAEAHRVTIHQMASTIDQSQKADQERIRRIRERTAATVHRQFRFAIWAVRFAVLLLFSWLLWWISMSSEHPFGSLSWVLTVLGVLGFIVPFMPHVTSFFSKAELNWAERRSVSKLLNAGFSQDQIEGADHRMVAGIKDRVGSSSSTAP
ncbi:hypothetical protein ACFSYH_00610 [Populibacterium corticicola]|uniref:Uncharacterized protein n=1 Tax=Populibacterium corticicola TaxID=1812826 RepID=A0ABW5X9E1_9MICO